MRRLFLLWSQAAGVGPEQRGWEEPPMAICVRPDTRARHRPGVTRRLPAAAELRQNIPALKLVHVAHQHRREAPPSVNLESCSHYSVCVR